MLDVRVGLREAAFVLGGLSEDGEVYGGGAADEVFEFGGEEEGEEGEGERRREEYLVEYECDVEAAPRGLLLVSPPPNAPPPPSPN